MNVVWPDWRGETAVIVGTGPSATAEPLEPFKGKARFFVIKSTWRLAPWADALYGLDRDWWIANQGCPKCKGLKFSPSPSACKVYGLQYVKLKPRVEILTQERGVIGCGLSTGGGHSGFQAINLAVQFGATRILLVGFDMTLAYGEHWMTDRGDSKADRGRTESWRVAMDACAPQFVALGVDVINCTMASALTTYPKMRLNEALP